MKDIIDSLGSVGLFEENCTVKISGEHFFFDPKLYTNMYGLSFFGSILEYSDNPYIAPELAGTRSLLDEFLDDGLAPYAPTTIRESALQKSIMQNVSKEFVVRHEKKKGGAKTFSLTCPGNYHFVGDGSILLTYGTVMPSSILIRNDTATMQMAFSPFSSVSLIKGQRVMHSADFPVQTSPLIPPELVTVDYVTCAKQVYVELLPNYVGVIDIEYYLEVAASKCESAKVHIEFLPQIVCERS